MSRTRTLLFSAALALGVPGMAHAQYPPRKGTRAVSEGMTPAQVREVLGSPIGVRHEGALTYLDYPCGRCGGNDYVVIRDCRVVAARFGSPARVLVHAPVPDASPPPAAECQVQPVATASRDRMPGAPNDVGPGGAIPVQRPRLVPAAPSAPSADAASASPAASPSPSANAAPSAGAPAAPAADAAAQSASPTASAAPSAGSPGAAAASSSPGATPAMAMAPAAPADTGAPEPPVPSGSPAEWRDRLTLRRPATHLVAVPAASVSSPTAFGVQMGEGFVGVTYQSRTRFTHVNDGSAVIGIGLGDRERLVGLEVSATSYSTLRGGGPLQTGAISFKLHRAITPTWGVAAGMENATTWGGSDAGRSPYVVATHVVQLAPDPSRPFSALSLSAGVGGGRFRSEQDVVNDRKTANVFGAVGLQVAQPVSVTADWTGQDLFAAVSVAPVHRLPLVVNAGLADITGNAGDGVRFIVSAGLGFRWLPPFF